MRLLFDDSGERYKRNRNKYQIEKQIDPQPDKEIEHLKYVIYNRLVENLELPENWVPPIRIVNIDFDKKFFRIQIFEKTKTGNKVWKSWLVEKVNSLEFVFTPPLKDV